MFKPHEIRHKAKVRLEEDRKDSDWNFVHAQPQLWGRSDLGKQGNLVLRRQPLGQEDTHSYFSKDDGPKDCQQVALLITCT